MTGRTLTFGGPCFGDGYLVDFPASLVRELAKSHAGSRGNCPGGPRSAELLSVTLRASFPLLTAALLILQQPSCWGSARPC